MTRSHSSLTRKLNGSTARIALIDADSVLYAAACQAEARSIGSGENGDDEWLQTKSLDQAYNEVTSKLHSLVEAVGASDAIVCLTPTGVKQFRSVLLPTYKANRTGRRPLILKELQERVMADRPFGVMAVRGLEADDVCGISSGNLQAAKMREPVIVSIDKDMMSVPGLTYSWLQKDRGIVEITEAQADRVHLYQTLIGDTVDNYTGCPGIGPKKATAILDSLEDAVGWSKWVWIVGQFAKRGLDEIYALTQARVARILRASDWNSTKREVTLWQPPKDTRTDQKIVQTFGAIVATVEEQSPHNVDAPAKLAPLPAARLKLDEILRTPGETVH